MISKDDAARMHARLDYLDKRLDELDGAAKALVAKTQELLELALLLDTPDA